MDGDDSFFDNFTLSLGSNLFSVSARGGHFFVIKEIFGIADDFPVRVKDFGSWDPQNGLRITDEPAYKRRGDLGGLLWRVGSIQVSFCKLRLFKVFLG